MSREQVPGHTVFPGRAPPSLPSPQVCATHPSLTCSADVRRRPSCCFPGVSTAQHSRAQHSTLLCLSTLLPKLGRTRPSLRTKSPLPVPCHPPLLLPAVSGWTGPKSACQPSQPASHAGDRPCSSRFGWTELFPLVLELGLVGSTSYCRCIF